MLNHEIRKAFTRPEFALVKANAEVSKAAPDREAVAAKIEVALEGFRKVLDIVGAVLPTPRR